MTGGEIYNTLEKAAVDAGVEILRHSKVVRLLVEDGAVVGVEVVAATARPLHGLLGKMGMIGGPVPALARLLEKSGKRYQVRAKAVVLCAGGFIFNKGLMQRYAPAYAGCMQLGTPGDDGSGLELGQAAGAELSGMDACAASRFICPPEAFVGGALVNVRGERFCDESLYGATLSAHISRQPQARAWLIIDARQHREAVAQLAAEERILDQPVGELLSGQRNALLFRKFTGSANLRLNRRKTANLAKLGAALGMPEGALPKTIADYNACAGVDPIGKRPEYLAQVVEAPFYAVDCRLDSSLFPAPCLTLGGLKVDRLTARVLRPDGLSIRGLFAAGRNAAGVCSRSYVSGLSIADCIFSGRNAGREAAALARA
jgi:3-oxo-5alpha-steroid 4-dehydrogenase